MAIPDDICIQLPKLSADLPKVSLPLGAQFQGMIDFANGLPTDCSAALSLMGNVNVALGNMHCLIAAMEVFQKFKGLFGPSFPFNLTELAEPLEKLAECFVSITPAAICVTIKDALQAIIKILQCVIDEIESIVDFRASLDVQAALTNDKLASILICAQDNANTSAESVLQVLQSLGALLNTLASLPGADQLGIPQLPTSFQVSAQTPSLSDIADVSAIRDVLNVLQDIVNVLGQVVDAVPC